MGGIRKLGWIAMILAVAGCGYPKPREIRPGVYQLQYCDDEQKCFDAAEKICPGDYRIIKYTSLRPEEFVCI